MLERIVTSRGRERKKLIEQAKRLGWEEYRHGKLSKNQKPENLAVLCPNCHRELHHLDRGKKILKSLPPRKAC